MCQVGQVGRQIGGGIRDHRWGIMGARGMGWGRAGWDGAGPDGMGGPCAAAAPAQEHIDKFTSRPIAHALRPPPPAAASLGRSLQKQ